MKSLIASILVVAITLLNPTPALSDDLPPDVYKPPSKIIKASGTLRFSGDGSRLLLVGDSHLEVWDTTNDKRISGPTRYEGFAAISLDGKLIAYGDQATVGKSMLVVARTTGQRIHEWKTGGPLWDVAFSPDSKRVTVAAPTAEVKAWDLTTGTSLPLAGSKDARTCGFSPDGAYIYLNNSDRTVSLFDAATGKAIAKPLQADVEVTPSSFKQDGTRLAVTRRQNVEIIALPSLKKLTEIQTPAAIGAYDVQWTTNRVVVAGASRARLYDIETGKQIGPVFGDKSLVFLPRFGSLKDQLIVEAQAGESGVWDIATGKQILGLAQDPWDLIPYIVVSGDGKLLATLLNNEQGTAIYKLSNERRSGERID